MLSHLLVVLHAQIDPAHRTEITVYHEHPANVAVGLENQDTGDLEGDSYFVLRGLLLPVECASKHAPKFDCDNPEQNSTSNVISMHHLAIDDRFGEYASCNAKDGKYACVCGSYTHPVPCQPPVGRVNVSERETQHRVLPWAPDWEFWRVNLAIKTGGFWFSTVRGHHSPSKRAQTLTRHACCGAQVTAGKCAGASAGGVGDAAAREVEADGRGDAACTWKLLATTRRIVSGCLETRVAEAIQAFDPTCFAGCSQPKNASSLCVARCYMQTILGPHGGERLINATEGMPRALLARAWQRAFASKDPAAGGCPDAPAPVGEEVGVEAEAEEWPMAWRGRVVARA